jgi:curved DNA-binding protein
MIYKDYYKELGVGQSATPGEIKSAYRALAFKYHPDHTKGDKAAEERFKAINEANEVLSDPMKRKKYDRFGDGYVDDLFEMLFGQRSGQRRGRGSVAIKGEDLAAETTLSLEEAYHGTVRLIQLNGQTIKVTIKPGIAAQHVLRMAGKGGSGSGGGPNGDLYLTVTTAPHPVYQRRENDLYRDLPVELYTAVLGGKTQIETFKGKTTVSIPKGTQNGRELRLRGLGMPVYGRKNEYGNLLVNVDILVPEHLSEEEVGLFRKLATLRKTTARTEAQ